MQGESARQSGNGKALESALFEIWKTIKKRQNAKTPKRLSYEMSTKLQRHGPKWKLTNYGLELRNDEVLVIK